jgi:DNA helicase II / ATP-dependent DNA helicase PcrA
MAVHQFVPSPEQQRVIEHRNGHLQVIACAGSGKTEAISRRVAQLVVDGTPPEAIIAFTFTERAAAAMKSRILLRVAERLGDGVLDRLSPMYVGTIHAYCMRMLQDHVPQYANYDVLDDHRHAGLLSRERRRLQLERLGDSRHWAPIHGFLRSVDVVENELIKPAKLKDTAFGDCYEDYCEVLQRYHFLTFGQLIKAAVEALQTPDIFARVHGPLRHLIVDEYQDINPAQERLIELLSQPPVTLCVVGDDDQAIYQWRGSNVQNMLSFKQRYKADTRSLSVNRRSRPGIIKAANTFARSIDPRLTKKMEPHRPDEGPQVHCWAADRAEDEATIIAQTIRKLANRGYRYRDMAVLLRSVRTSSPPILEALKKAGIPVRCAGRTGLFLQPEAQLLGRTYAWLAGNSWKPEQWGKAEEVDLAGLVADYGEVFGPSSGLKQKLSAYLQDWQERARGDNDSANLVLELYRLLRLLGVHQWDLGDPQWAARMGCLARFSELLADFEHVRRRARWVEENGGSVYRGGQSRGQWYYRNLFNYIQYYALDAYEEFAGEETHDLNAVDIITVHQAKGLEWPVVFVPCLVSGRFPSRYAGGAEDWLVPEKAFSKAARLRYEGSDADERRLFYVAMTRARDMLYLSRCQRKKNRFAPSPFLVAVAGGDPALATTLPLPPRFKPEADAAEDKPTISFSELAAYDDCPRSYRLMSLLGFQPQLVAELGYGKAIHHILRRIADWVRKKGKLPDAKAVERIFREEFYLPFAHRAAYAQLREAADRLVGQYLGKYSDDLFRIWQTERPFELHLKNGIVSGRADVILDCEGGTPGSLALVDYKTATEVADSDISAFQLAVYTAAGLGEGINIRGAYLHDLSQGQRIVVPVLEQAKAARARADQLVKRIVGRQFEARPEKSRCGQCDVRFVCRHGPGR